MATIKNLMGTHLDPKQLDEVRSLMTNLENVLRGMIVNLSAEERTRYGRVNEQNKLLINKVRDYAQTRPALRCMDVDWDEFERDYQSRAAMEELLARLQNLFTGMKNMKILHDFDNYQAALDDYSYTSYKAGTAAAGFEDKRNDLKQFFTRSRRIAEASPPSENPDNAET